MAEYDLVEPMKDVKKLMERFDTLDLQNVKDVLEWFYDTQEYRSMFEDADIADHIRTRLLESGYSKTLTPRDELDIYEKLIKKSDDVDEEEVGKLIVSQLLTFLTNKDEISIVLWSFIEIYNELYNKEKTTSKMMQNVREYIDKDVVCVGFHANKSLFLTGVLEEVNDFDSIRLAGDIYTFIGDDTAISGIYTPEGKTLYRNSRIKRHYIHHDEQEVIKLSEDTFGEHSNKKLVL